MINLMETVNEWTQRLAYLVLAVTFLELLAPENQLKKLVKVIIGFLITAAIIMPLANWFRLERGLEAYPFFDQIVESSADNQWGRDQRSTLSHTTKLYIATVELEIMRRLEAMGVTTQVQIDWTPEYGLQGARVWVQSGSSANLGQLLAEMLSLREDQVEIRY